MDSPPSLKTIYMTLGRDIKALKLYFRTYSFMKRCYFRNRSVLHYFRKRVAHSPNEVCFIFEDEEWTFKQIDDFSDKVAQLFKQQGYLKGDEVALFMENCPEYVCFWLGLAKIGVVTAFINTNQKSESLAHSMNIIDLKGVIFGQSLAESLKKALPLVDKKDTADFYCYTRQNEDTQTLSFQSKSMNALLDSIPVPVNLENINLNFQDKLLYIYTSGTTGFPKAAIVRHSRFLWIAAAAKYISQLDTPQVYYNTLPMYHTSGGILFLGVALMFEGKMVLRKKFSASNFWKEAVKHKVTVFQYIGEICRYLLNQPKRPEETQHSIWLCFGNGLKPHVWKEFQQRFKIKNIIEMYGATEGNANLVNMFGKEGAVGFISRIFSKLYPVYLIKINPETGEIMRDEKGFCIRCKPGEPGELVGKIKRNNPLNSFDGYVNPNETKKKIIKDCFKKGDIAFLSGDILVMDDEGYLYFKDRTGDTFRWKGENVSTTEVENIISKISNHSSCVVYGVEIPGSEGRAGMAAIQTNTNSIDLNDLYRGAKDKLPLYAIPIFIRLCSDIEATGTHKLIKLNLQKDGYNPKIIKDSLYYLDAKKETYMPLTEEIYSDIINGKFRL